MHSATILSAVVGLALFLHVALMSAFHILFRRRGSAALDPGDTGRREKLPLSPSVDLVTVLKPLAGHDDDLEANLESFARLEHHRYELLFGVASPSDSALPVARAFIARHPEVDARVVFTAPDAATNPKIAQLIALAEAARGDVLVTSDSNVRVRPAYLREVLAPLADPRCGLVTSLFAGTGERTLGAALENLQIGAMITPSVVLSTLGQPVTVGKSMAMRRCDLERIGGFVAFGDVLAEDLMIGRAVTHAKMRIATSFFVIENRNVVGSLARTFDRHARWTKMRRSISPSFCLLEPLLSPVLVSLAAAVAAPTRTMWLLFAAAIVVQTFTAFTAAWTIRGRGLALRQAPLEVVRVFVLFACWLTAWMSRTVLWRGHTFTIGAGSVITRVRDRASEENVAA